MVGPTAVVLGIAQDAGVPQPGCTRPCCAPAWADPSLRRLPACLGLVDGDRGWLIDATPAIGEQLHRLGVPLAGIVLTHAHMGHITGLLQLGREGAGMDRLPVYAMPRLAAFLRTSAPWELLERAGHIELRDLSGGAALGGIEVSPMLVPHRDEYSETVAVVVQGPHRRVLWLPDIDAWDRDLVSLVDSVDVAFLDGTFWSAEEVGRGRGRDPSPVGARHPRPSPRRGHRAGTPGPPQPHQTRAWTRRAPRPPWSGRLACASRRKASASSWAGGQTDNCQPRVGQRRRQQRGRRWGQTDNCHGVTIVSLTPPTMAAPSSSSPSHRLTIVSLTPAPDRRTRRWSPWGCRVVSRQRVVGSMGVVGWVDLRHQKSLYSD